LENKIVRAAQIGLMRECKMDAMKPEFLKPTEACVALKISRSKLYEALQRGLIPSTKIAGLTRIPRRWIDEQVQNALTTMVESES
jgi:excisionase family DNA binding protein